MKKTIILCFSVLFTNFLMAQSIVVNAKGTAEVGITENFSLTFKPSYPPGSNCYKINSWLIIANIGSGTITGSLSNQSSPNFYYNPPLDEVNTDSKTINIPIKWGDNAGDTDNIEIQVSGTYGNMVNDTYFPSSDVLFSKYKKQNGGDTGYTVDIKKVCSPNISTPTVLACSIDNVQISASGYCDADKFTWTVSGGTIAAGQGTSTITVTPIGNENVTTTCIVGRTSGLSYYTASRTQTISRTSRNVSFTTNIAQNYMCKGSGLIYQIDNQNTISNVIWNAPNCTISPETIVNGKRQVTISPNSSIGTGSSIAVSATVNYFGGCSATTPSKTFNIYESGTPQIPQGTISFTSQSGDICNPGVWIVKFKPSASSPFVNGEISIDPPTIIPGKGKAGPYDFEVCYTNICSGMQTCNTITRNTPVPCITARLASSNETLKLVISPNPTNGSFEVIFPERLSGNYQIFDQNNVLIQENKFGDQSKLQIELQSRLKSGIYILKVITDDNIFTDKIILNK